MRAHNGFLCSLQVKKMRKEFDSDVRFILMNSFSTSEDTTEHLKGTHPDLIKPGWELMQNKSPKVDAATMAPATYAASPDMEWYDSFCPLASSAEALCKCDA
jgi:UDP-N-acetylglucosamine pyrophosphorylase